MLNRGRQYKRTASVNAYQPRWSLLNNRLGSQIINRVRLLEATGLGYSVPRADFEAWAHKNRSGSTSGARVSLAMRKHKCAAHWGDPCGTPRQRSRSGASGHSWLATRAAVSQNRRRWRWFLNLSGTVYTSTGNESERCGLPRWKVLKWLDGVNSLFKIYKLTRANRLVQQLAKCNFALALQGLQTTCPTILVVMISRHTIAKLLLTKLVCSWWAS
jgi:hypothetical protein